MQNRIAVFIDGANLYATTRALAFDIDFKRLLIEFGSRGNLVRASYYTALLEDQEFNSIRPLIDWLDYNGYTVVTKPTKEFTDSTGRRKIKGNMDIELAVDAMELAEHVDQIVLFSGDGDFRSLVESNPAARRPCNSGLNHPDPTGDDCRRAAAAGGRLHRPGRPQADYRPRSGGAAGTECGVNKLALSFAKPVFGHLADGQWHNFLTHEARAGDISVREWFWQAIGLGILLGHGYAEQDDTWARLTPKGKEAFAVYVRDGEAAHA
jgi:hypothetical protein